jgi:hydroxymethylpyrimidine/phosphomethylpyrimidine kinase
MTLNPHETALLSKWSTDARPKKRAAAALSVDIHDPWSCQGVTADLCAFAACGVRGHSVLSGIGQRLSPTQIRCEPIPSHHFQMALHNLDLAVDAARITTPLDLEQLRHLAEALERKAWGRVLYDPQLIDREGRLDRDINGALAARQRLLPHLTLLVLNSQEAALLTQSQVPGLSAMKEACRRLADWGAPYILITGGRIDDHAVDLLYDGSGFTEWGSDRREGHFVGPGPVLSATITALLARRLPLLDAVAQAKEWITKALDHPMPCPQSGAYLTPNPWHRVWQAIDLDPQPIETAPATPHRHP